MNRDDVNFFLLISNIYGGLPLAYQIQKRRWFAFTLTFLSLFFNFNYYLVQTDLGFKVTNLNYLSILSTFFTSWNMFYHLVEYNFRLIDIVGIEILLYLGLSELVSSFFLEYQFLVLYTLTNFIYNYLYYYSLYLIYSE